MKNQSGISLIEPLVVIVIVGLLVFLLANLPNAMNLISKSRHLSLAREIALKQVEDKRNTSFANLVNEATPVTDQRIGLLPSGAGTVLVEDCLPSVCTNNEAIKQVTVTITWLENSKPQTASLKTFVGEGGLNQ